MLKKLIPFAVFVFHICFVSGQNEYQSNYQIEIRQINAPIIIDGKTDETWSLADSANRFQNHRPIDQGLAQSQTTVKMLFDEEFI